MSEIQQILSKTAHRPFEMPKGNWVYYQEWNRVIFLHWEVPYDVLRKLVPADLDLDNFDGKYYVSVVPFTMEKIRPKYLPSVSFISDFDEINIRTYVEKNGKKGVYFLNIEAGKWLSAFISKSLSGLPYEKSDIQRTDNQYISKNNRKDFHLNIDFQVSETLTQKTNLDLWLTERYCLFLDLGKNLYCYDIHHEEWEVKQLIIKNLEIKYTIGDCVLTHSPTLSHYSNGIKVVSWKREKL